MTAPTNLLLRSNLKQLKLPTVLAEYEKLAREAADASEPYDAYLLRLTELEVAARSVNAQLARIRAAAFPVAKDFDNYDFTGCRTCLSRKSWNWLAANGSSSTTTAVSSATPARARRIWRRLWAWPLVVSASACDSSPPPAWSTSWKKPSRSTASTASWPSWTAPICSFATNWATYRSAAAGRTTLPGLRRTLRAEEPVGHEQSGLRRMGPDIPRGADDRGDFGPPDAPLPHLRDERRKFPLPRVDEDEERQRAQEGEVTLLLAVVQIWTPIVVQNWMPITNRGQRQ